MDGWGGLMSILEQKKRGRPGNEASNNVVYVSYAQSDSRFQSLNHYAIITSSTITKPRVCSILFVLKTALVGF